MIQTRSLGRVVYWPPKEKPPEGAVTAGCCIGDEDRCHLEMTCYPPLTIRLEGVLAGSIHGRSVVDGRLVLVV
jgi:hypothetical protein